jgi:hypothetical protein
LHDSFPLISTSYARPPNAPSFTRIESRPVERLRLPMMRIFVAQPLSVISAESGEPTALLESTLRAIKPFAIVPWPA